MALPPTLNRHEAQELVRDLADLSWPVLFTTHAEYRSETRHVDQSEVLRVLMRGTVVTDPIWDSNFMSWKVDVEAELDEVYIKVHAAIDEERPGKMILVVLTVVANDIPN